jgi:5-guanidino-2-oxopentanoate decarboxylase
MTAPAVHQGCAGELKILPTSCSKTDGPQMTDQNCGQAAIALLEKYGVDTVFGMPGVHTLEFYRGLTTSKIRHIAVRHEQGAGFMADGYARASGRPGVCVLISGPGLTNAATPIGQAYSDSIPMLILSSVNATDDLGKGRGRLHEITSQQATIAPLTAFSRTIYRAEDLPAAYTDAYRIFEAGRPRPVHIEVPLDVLAGSAPRLGDRPAAGRPPAPDPVLVARACALISKAQRPVIVAGGGIIDHGPVLTSLAERIAAPVIPTIAAKGTIPDSHPLCVGATLSMPQTQAFVRSADLVIAVGTELGGEADAWIDRLPIEGKLIRIDIDPAALTRDYPPDVAIHADGGATLAALAESVATSRSEISAGEVAQLRAEIRDALPPLQRKHMLVLGALRAELPGDGIVSTDMTQIAYSGSYYFPCEQPRCWFHPVGYGTLGYGLPAAIGAKLAQPHRATVALVGDGGLLFTVQELATAVELGLPIAIVLWNNNALAQIAEGMNERGIPEIGVRPRNPDFIKMAEAFGCRTARPQSLMEFRESLKSAFKADGPTLIEVREDADFLDG